MPSRVTALGACRPRPGRQRPAGHLPQWRAHHRIVATHRRNASNRLVPSRSRRPCRRVPPSANPWGCRARAPARAHGRWQQWRRLGSAPVSPRRPPPPPRCRGAKTRGSSPGCTAPRIFLRSGGCAASGTGAPMQVGGRQPCPSRSLQRRNVALGQPQLTSLEQPAHDLTASRLG